MPIRFFGSAMANADSVGVTEIETNLKLADRDPRVRGDARCARALLLYLVLRRPGGFSEEPEPDPISNSAVKLLSADGT